jgi:hypothetical protein
MGAKVLWLDEAHSLCQVHVLYVVQSLGNIEKNWAKMQELLYCAYTGWSESLCAPDDYNTESYK